MLREPLGFAILELFFILSFHTLVFVCYNWLVAHFTTIIVRLSDRLRKESVQETKDVISDLADIFKGEEQTVTEEIKEISNNKSLSAMLVQEATEADYNEFVDKVSEIVRELYKNYQFLRQDPAPDDFVSGYFLAFQIVHEQYPVEYEYLFRLAIDRGLNPVKINEVFVERLSEGKVLDLGDTIVYKGVSGISSILQGEAVRVNITFATPEYYEKGKELQEKQIKELDDRKAKQAEEAKQKDAILKSLRVASEVLEQLTDEVAEKYDMEELVKKIREGLGY